MHDIIGTLSLTADIGFKISYQISASTLLFAQVDAMLPMFPVNRRYVNLLCHL